MSQQRMNPVNILKYLGAIVAFCIGAGFATGQEVMQFFTAYGIWGLAGSLISLVLYIFMCCAFMATGKTTNFRQSNDVFKYYCGKTLGTALEWYSIVLLFLIYVTMISGAGAVFSDYYQLSAIYGQILMSVLAVAAVLVGFNRLMSILGPLGPIIVVGCIAVAIAAVFYNLDGFAGAAAFVESAPMTRASATWWLSGILYPTFMSFLLASFVTAMGATATSKREAIVGGAAGAIAFSVGVILVTLAQIANVELIYDKEIPMLYLAKSLVPFIASVFSVILLAGIFTTSAPLLWSTVVKFAPDGTGKFRLLVIVLALAAFAVSFMPFTKLVNIVYPASGWLGIVLILLMAYKHIRLRIGTQDQRETNASCECEGE